MNRLASLLLGLYITFGLWSCAQKSVPVAKPAYAVADGQYDVTPPVKGVSPQLQKIAQTVYRLNVIAFYESYSFAEQAQITLTKFNEKSAKEQALTYKISTRSGSGTTSVIYSDAEKAALITCAHVVHFPDTIVVYFPNNPALISTISIKIKQSNFVAGLKNPAVEVMAFDKERDIALLKAQLTPGERIPVMPFPVGKSSELQWGTFVYVMGFPEGQKMVESGIVSQPDVLKKGVFLTNAIFNPGISGGPVFAIRDGAKGFEWVGMAKSSPAEDIFYLEPKTDNLKTYSKLTPYSGPQLINKKKMINYGVTFSVSMEEIVRFVKSMASRLEQEEFDIRQFFYHPPE
jgi:S1-C subfamily serine protease